MVAKIKILVTQKRFKHMESLLASGSRDLPGGVMSYLLQADAWGICLPSRWLCWESIFCIWFLESIKLSVKLFVLQSRGLREVRLDENKRE